MAELKQDFTVAHPRPEIWRAFQDIETLVTCLPGASLTEQPTANEAKGQMSVKLGMIKANFDGKVKMESDDDNYVGMLKGSGVDTKQNSRASSDVRYTLEESNNGTATKVFVTIDYTLSGSLAQFARGGVVEAFARTLTDNFASNLEAKLSSNGELQSTNNGSMSTKAPRQGASGELNILTLLGATIKRWFKGLFSKKT